MSESRGRLRVAFPLAELEVGQRKVIRLGRREVLVLHEHGRLYALHSRCPHRLAPLIAGEVRSMRRPVAVGGMEYDTEARVLLCPWHRYEFELSTGLCPADPRRLRVAVYEIRVEGDEVAVYG